MRNEKKYLSALILKHMTQNHLAQKDMALVLGVRPSTLCEWLNPAGHGITRKNAERIKFICRESMPETENGPANHSAAEAVEKFRAGLISALIDAELPPDALKTALTVVKNFPAEN